jgi:hypothetical protein
MRMYMADPVEQLASLVAREQLSMAAAQARLESSRDQARLVRLVALLAADPDEL